MRVFREGSLLLVRVKITKPGCPPCIPLTDEPWTTELKRRGGCHGDVGLLCASRVILLLHQVDRTTAPFIQIRHDDGSKGPQDKNGHMIP